MTLSRSVLLMLFAGVALVACSESEPSGGTSGQSGISDGSSVSGATGSTGASGMTGASGKSGASGTTGGSGVSGTTTDATTEAGDSMMGEGGASGTTDGSTDSAVAETGSETSTPTTYACAGAKPPAALITDFGEATPGEWTSETWSGGNYVYPDTIGPTFTTGAMRVATRVSTYTGFGVWFGACADLSQYQGVRFTIGGNVGTAGTLRFLIQLNDTQAVNTTDKKGACIPDDPAAPWMDCVDPAFSITVPATPTAVTVNWSQLSGGVPRATVDPKQILGFQWVFEWTDATDPYDVDVTLDNVELVAAP